MSIKKEYLELLQSKFNQYFGENVRFKDENDLLDTLKTKQINEDNFNKWIEFWLFIREIGRMTMTEKKENDLVPGFQDLVAVDANLSPKERLYQALLFKYVCGQDIGEVIISKQNNELDKEIEKREGSLIVTKNYYY